MKPKTIFTACFFLLFINLEVLSQENHLTDSLKIELKNCSTTADSVPILCQLVWEYSNLKNAEGIKLGFMALEKAQTLTDSSVIADAYDAAGMSFRLDGQLQPAIEHYQKSLDIGLRNNLFGRIAWSNYNLALIALQQGHIEEGEKYIQKSCFYFKKENSQIEVLDAYRLMVKAGQNHYIDTLILAITDYLPDVKVETDKLFYYLEISRLYNKLEDRNRAMHYVQLAMEITEKNKNYWGNIKVYYQIADYFQEIQHNYPMALAYLEKILELNTQAKVFSNGDLYLQIGDNHRLLGNDSLALSYFERALEVGQKKNHRHSKASAYMKIGELRYQQHQFDDALFYYLKCYDTGCDVCPQITFHDALLNIGNVYLFSDDTPNARVYFQKSLDLAESANNDRAKTNSFQSFAALYENQGNLNKAIQYSILAYQLAINADYLEGQRFNASRLSELYQKQNNYQQAFRYLSITNILSDSISKTNAADNLAKLETYFDFQNLQVQNELATTKSNEEIARQKLLRNFFIIGFLILAISGFLIFIGYRRKRKDNILLSEQKLEIEKMSKKVHDADQAKLQFYTNISHEFKTPLTLILGMTEKIKTHLHENQYVDIIRKNSFKLLQLVNHLLDLRKIDAHKMKLSVKEGNIDEFLKGIISSYESIGNQKKIKVEFVGLNKPVFGFFDFNKMEQIISNLLSNAFKYTQKNGWVKVEVLHLEDGYVTIEVSDNGIGIPENEVAHIFNRFYRVIDSDNKGTGIGLALVKELVHLHKGEIIVSSKKMEGASFSVRIPIEKRFYNENEITSEVIETGLWNNIEMLDIDDERKKTEDVGVLNPDRKTILIVEDNYDLRKFIGELFSDEYVVLEAADGAEGCLKAKEFVPDIIISDIMMPKMSGIQLVETVKNDVTTSHIPIVLLTAKNDIGSQLSSFEKGADDYISKPFDSVVLKSRVENLLRLRKQLVEKFSKQFHLQPREITIEDADQKFLQKTISIIEKHISNPGLNVDMLALELDVSRTQLYRKLKALTDYSANRFIRIIRIKRAAQILRQGQNNIAEVMDATGFSNYSYFNNCFKEYFGEFPKEYALLSVSGSSN